MANPLDESPGFSHGRARLKTNLISGGQWRLGGWPGHSDDGLLGFGGPIDGRQLLLA